MEEKLDITTEDLNELSPEELVELKIKLENLIMDCEDILNEESGE